jgi:hypothetical protein
MEVLDFIIILKNLNIGVLYLDGSGEAEIENSEFVNCSSGHQGGAIDANDDYNLTVTFCLFDRCYAQGFFFFINSSNKNKY